MYGYDDQGRVVGELGAADGVRWTVHAANKAAWYGYSNAMDGGDNAPGIPGALRSADIEPARREEMLVINAGRVRIDGVSKNADGRDASYRMAGQFWKKLPVTLGHLRTDDAGRLLVFPADGVSNSALPQNPVRDFTNNDGWHDDACGLSSTKCRKTCGAKAPIVRVPFSKSASLIRTISPKWTQPSMRRSRRSASGTMQSNPI